MAGRGTGRLLWVLAVIHPPVPFQTVQRARASHELPHAARARPRQRQRLKSRLRLCQVDQVLGNALLLENPRDHVAITAGAGPGALQCGPTPRAGVIVDEHRHLIVEHQRQVRLGGLDLGLGRGPDVGIDRKGDVVGFVDGRRFGAWLGETVALLQRRHFKLVDGLDNLVELALQPLVVADVEIAGQQRVERLIEVLLGRLQMVRPIVGLSGCVLLLGLRNQRLGRIGLRIIHLELDFGLGISRWVDGTGDLGSFGLSGDGSGGRFGLIGLASGAEHQACEEGRRNHAAKNSHSFEAALSHTAAGG